MRQKKLIPKGGNGFTLQNSSIKPTSSFNFKPLDYNKTPSFGGLKSGFNGIGGSTTGFDTSKFRSAGTGGKSALTSKDGLSVGAVAGGLGSIASLASTFTGNSDVELDEYGIEKPEENTVGKGAGAGAMKGFEMGKSFGPWGMAIGTLLGAAGGAGFAYKKLAKTNTNYANSVLSAQTAQKRSMLQLGRSGMKLRTQGVMEGFTDTKRVIPIFKKGGAMNVIPDGKLHKEKNSLGNGDKGIPVVDGEGKKLFELEKEELIMHLGATKEFEAMVAEYNKTKDSAILIELGKKLTEELIANTKDYSEKYGLEETSEA